MTTVEQQAQQKRDAWEIKARVFTPIDTTLLAPRDWLYKRIMLRGFVTATFAPGAGAKTQTVLTDMVAIACGFDLMTRRPFKRGPLNVWFINVEDDDDEITRRLSAICKFYNVTAQDLGDRFRFDTDREGRYVVAKGSSAGVQVTDVVIDSVLEIVKDEQIDVIAFDPLVGMHCVNENINGEMNIVMGQLRKIAGNGQCAVHVLHHVRKGGDGEITAEDGRGAAAIKDACRAVRTLTPMSEKDATSFCVPPEKRRFYIHENQGGKSNLTAPGGDRDYFYLNSVSLENGNDLNDDDYIGVPSPWVAPDVFDGLSLADCEMIWQRIAAEPEPLKTCRESSQADGFVGRIVCDVLGWDYVEAKAKVKKIIGVWIKNKRLVVKYKKGGNGTDIPYVVVNEIKSIG